MAEDLGVSASYLNLLERNQRPVTAQVLLRLAETYDLDLRSLVERRRKAAGATGLSEVFADQMFRDLGVARHELDRGGRERARASPRPSCGSTAPISTAAALAGLNAFDRPEEMALTTGALTPVGLGARLHPGPAQLFRRAGGGGRGAWPRRWAPSRRTSPSPPASGWPSATASRCGSCRWTCCPTRCAATTTTASGSSCPRCWTSSGRAFALAYQLALLEHAETINAHRRPRPSRRTGRPAACCASRWPTTWPPRR